MKSNPSIKILNRDFTPLTSPPNLSLTVNSYSFNMLGGPESAGITAWGTEADLWELANMLRMPIEIMGNDGFPAWWGFISKVEIRIGWVSCGVSLENMSNKIKVIYTNLGERGDTDWKEDQVSVSTYGTKELVVSLNEATIEQANSRRDAELSAKGKPIASVNFESSEEGGYSATITCSGWMETLDWVRYKQINGLEQNENTAGGSKTRLGARYSSSEVSFYASCVIHDDAASGLVIFQEGDIIHVDTNTGKNDGDWVVVGKGSDNREIYVTYFDKSAERKIQKDIDTTASFITGCVIGQDFQHTTGSTWFADALHLRMRKEGSPTGDVYVWISGSSIVLTDLIVGGSSFTASLYSSFNIASGMVAVSSMASTIQWVEIPLVAGSQKGQVVSGSVYSIGMLYSGACNYHTSSPYYVELELDEKLRYARGAGYTYTGCGFHQFKTDADLLFKVVGTMAITNQIETIVQDCGQFLLGTDIKVASSIKTNLWRDGEKTAYKEIQELIDSGTGSGLSIMVTVTPERILRITEEPDQNDKTKMYYIDSNRYIYNSAGVRVDESRPPYGVWVTLKDVIPTTVNMAHVQNPTKFFIESIEYMPEQAQLTPKARELDDPWKLGLEINQG